MDRTRKLGGALLPLVLFASAAVAFYWPALGGGLVLLPLDNLWTMPPWFGPPDAVPHNLLIGDMLLENYPWKLILVQALQQRALPLWNPYEMVGLPYLATGQTGALYPLTALFLLGPLRAYGWYSALHQVLAGGLTYLFLRRLGVGRYGALVAGLTFAFSFFLTVSYIWPMVLGAAVWLPLALWSLAGLAQAVRHGTLRRALAIDLPIGALAIGLSVLGGHLEITFYATFAVALYGVYLLGELWRRGQRRGSGAFALAAALAVGLGVLLAAVQLVPFLEVLGTNNRQGDTTYRQVISYALPRRQVLGLLLPDFFGNPTAHDYFDLTTLRRTPVGNNALGQPTDPPHTIFWGTKNYVEAGGYVGVVPLLLAAVGALRARRPGRWFFVGLAAFSLLLAFGTPLYALIYYGLPFFSQLRTPFRWLYLFDFATAVLAGLGADWLVGLGKNAKSHLAKRDAPTGALDGETRNAQARRWRDGGTASRRLPASRFSLLVRWLPALLGAGGLLALGASFLWRGQSVAAATRILERSPELQRAFASGAMLYSYEARNLGIFFGLLAVGGTLVALLSGPLARHLSGSTEPKARSALRAGLAALLLVTIVGDLFFFGARFATKAPASLLSQRVELNAALPSNPTGPRVVSFGDPVVLPANLGVILGIPSVGGYDTIIARDFVRLWSLVEPPVDLPFNQIGRLHRATSLGSPILDLLGVRYVLTEALLNDPAVRLVGAFGPVRIYERPTALPRALVVGDVRWVPDRDAALRALAEPAFRPERTVVLEGAPEGSDGGRGSAALLAEGTDQVTVWARVDGSAWLVLSDAAAPGWSATVDGAPAPIRTADAALRAVHLDSGEHQIVFRYRPLSLQLGAYVSFLAAVVLTLLATHPLWRRLTGHYAGPAERVLRNATLPLATSFLNKAIDFGFAILMLRLLGPASVGAYTVAVILVGYVEIFTNFGLNALIMREVARDRSAAGRYLADAVALRLGLCALAAPVVGALVLFGGRWFGLADQGVLAFALLALAVIPSNLTGALSALFTAFERTDLPAAITVATTLARVTLATAALLLGAGIVGLAGVALLLNLVLVVVFVVATRRVIRVGLVRPVPADLPALLAESYPLFLNHVLVTVFFKIDALLLQVLKDSATVGYYATAYKWLDGFLIIPSTFTFAVFPALSRFAEAKGEGLLRAYETSLRILIVVAVPLAVGVAFLAGDLILLLGGPAYYPRSAEALAILIWFLPFSFANGLTQYALIAVHRQRFITLAFVVAAAFNLGANLLFIPSFGLTAASVVTVLSEVVLMVPFLVAVRQSIGWPRWVSVAGKPALAGGLMVLIAEAGRFVEPHLALGVALAAYFGAIGALRVFSPDEIALARRLLGRRADRGASALSIGAG